MPTLRMVEVLFAFSFLIVSRPPPPFASHLYHNLPNCVSAYLTCCRHRRTKFNCNHVRSEKPTVWDGASYIEIMTFTRTNAHQHTTIAHFAQSHSTH
uniref:Putative secreted protein n=1 Tax=Anopheles marajoara TaxID=58244 RepID=A0A2M4C976_9DIPT